jgi:hypothetical protein
LNHAVEKYVAYARVTALNDDAGDALAPLPAGVEAGQAVNGVLADDGAGVDPAADDAWASDGVAGVPAADNARADGVAPAAPSWQHGEAQMIRLHVRSQALKGGHYQVSLGFPGQMELRLPVESPQPLAPGWRTALVPPLAASRAATSLLERSHFHLSGALKFAGDYEKARHRTSGFGV